MKYPNPTFLQKASKVRHTRRTRTLIILVILGVITLAAIFVSRVAAMQDIYRRDFPELVGAGTSTAASSTETTETSETSEATEESTTTIATEPVPIIAERTEEPPEDTEITSETTQNDFPDPIIEEDVFFSNSHPLQTLSHEQREILLDSLKQSVMDYAAANPEERISYRYVNLASNETMGINDLTPVIPAGSFVLPIELVAYEQIGNGRLSPTSNYTYLGETAPGNSSYIADNYLPGKNFYLRTLLNLAIRYNDNIALAQVIEKIGGMEYIWNRISRVSDYINYTENVTYTDYTGFEQRGPSRTSVYDLANYAEYLYHGYVNSPQTYQSLINDMAQCEVPGGIEGAFSDASLFLHVCGRNQETGSYTEIAIIDADEPIVLVISCECASLDRACTIQADLATYTARFLRQCHTEQ
ncbi:MAG: serine hydrolase [Clostridiales bacterium]|nr:serine hydrolase [Clostridiales bacterium]